VVCPLGEVTAGYPGNFHGPHKATAAWGSFYIYFAIWVGFAYNLGEAYSHEKDTEIL
jgi:hypothetical protein